MKEQRTSRCTLSVGGNHINYIVEIATFLLPLLLDDDDHHRTTRTMGEDIFQASSGTIRHIAPERKDRHRRVQFPNIAKLFPRTYRNLRSPQVARTVRQNNPSLRKTIPSGPVDRRTRTIKITQ